MRLIDADALVEKIESEIYRYWNGDGGGYYLAEDAVKEVEAAPTVDAVPVVRCKDCKREVYCECTQYQGENGYCSLGERRDGD